MRPIRKLLLFTLPLPLLFAARPVQTTEMELLRRSVDSCALTDAGARRPLIGVSASNSSRSSAGKTYTDAVILAGATPVILPVTDDVAALREMVDRIDALLLTGGVDLAPGFYRQEAIPELGEVDKLRDRYEIALLRLAETRRMPVLGICRGAQLINVYYGGTLWQDLPAQCGDTTHRQRTPGSEPAHEVRLIPGTALHALTGCDTYPVNSFHHQAVRECAPLFRVSALAAGGVVEAIEAADGRPIAGVQFHPEIMVAAGDTVLLRIFSRLTEWARDYAAQRRAESPSSGAGSPHAVPHGTEIAAIRVSGDRGR